MKISVKSMTRAAMIAALYVVLTLIFQAISFGPVQFRISEALTLLPILTADAIPGLFIGCLLANMLGGALWFDVLFGSIATLLAAILTYRLRSKPMLAAAMPTIFNAVIVGPVVYFAYSKTAESAFSIILLLKDVLSVAIGEVVVCYVLGMLLIHALKKAPVKIFE